MQSRVCRRWVEYFEGSVFGDFGFLEIDVDNAESTKLLHAMSLTVWSAGPESGHVSAPSGGLHSAIVELAPTSDGYPQYGLDGGWTVDDQYCGGSKLIQLDIYANNAKFSIWPTLLGSDEYNNVIGTHSLGNETPLPWQDKHEKIGVIYEAWSQIPELPSQFSGLEGAGALFDGFLTGVSESLGKVVLEYGLQSLGQESSSWIPSIQRMWDTTLNTWRDALDEA